MKDHPDSSDEQNDQPKAPSGAVPPIRRRGAAVASAPSDADVLATVDEGWDSVEEVEPAKPSPAPAPAPVIAPAIATEPAAPPIAAQPPTTTSPRSEPKEARRTHDVRAPRISRSTRDSPQFHTPEAPASPRDRRPQPRPAQPRPENRPAENRSAERTRPARADVRDMMGPRRPVRGPVIDDLDASPRERAKAERRDERRDASKRPEPPADRREAQKKPPAEKKPVEAARAPQSPRVAPPPPEPPPPPAVEAPAVDEMRIWSARPVSEKKQPKRKDRPKTAKEALVARAQQRRTEPAGKKRKHGKATPQSTPRAEARNAAAERKASAEKARDVEETESAEETETETTEAPAKRGGFWQRIKGLFGG